MNNQPYDDSSVGRLPRWFLASVNDDAQGKLTHQGIIPLYREAAFRYVSLASLVFLLPISIFNIIDQRWLLGGIEFLISLLMALHCWRLFKNNKPLFTAQPMVYLSIGALLLSFIYGRDSNIYWAPAIVSSFYFMLERPLAIRLNLFFLFAMVPICLIKMTNNHSIIFLLSLITCSVCALIFSSVVLRQELSLKRQATIDPLTSALNRRHLMETLDYSQAMLDRHNIQAAVILLDIDYFKQVNDQYGHATGDQVLVNVVKLIQQRLRREEKLFRYGGEEFLLLLTQTSIEQAKEMAEQLCAMIREAKILDDKPLTISCGVSALHSGESSMNLIKRCDQALYQAKNTGRDRVYIADHLLAE